MAMKGDAGLCLCLHRSFLRNCVSEHQHYSGVLTFFFAVMFLHGEIVRHPSKSGPAFKDGKVWIESTNFGKLGHAKLETKITVQ